MQITATQLNQVANLIGNTDKNTVITVAIGTLLQAGIAVDAAIDAVLGQGAYLKMAGEIYEALRAK